MSHSKYPSFWPFPGGVENFVESLNKALAFIRNNKPSEEQMTKWFFASFPKVKKRGNIRGYISVTLRHSGLVVINRNGITLSEDGKKYLDKPDSKLLFKILDNNVLGFKEALTVLAEKPLNLDEFHKALMKELEPHGVKWTEAHGQPYWRVNWLRALGFVALSGHVFCITNSGRELLTELGISTTERRKETVVQPPPLETTPEIVEEICNELKATEHASSEPEKYEKAIAVALYFLGFDVQHRGEPGETDVIAMANLGEQKYTIILDGKTTAGEKIIDRHISWPTMEEHREQHKADYAIVVGPSFAGGDLLERAKMRYKVLLLETDVLTKLLKIHSKTPLTLTDLREIFSKVGLLRLEECDELEDKRRKYARQFELLSIILYKLEELQRRGDPTTIADLHWALEKKFDRDEIHESLGLLQHLGIIVKTEREEYIAMMNPEVAAAKLRIFAEAISHS